jgi:hypothetical protein
MRGSPALRALCVAAAILAGGAAGATADDADSESDDDGSDGAPSAKSALLVDLLPGSSAKDLLTGGIIVPDQTLYFIGVDSWRYGIGGYTGLQWEPAQLSNNKFILRLFSSDSFDRYSGDRHRYATQTARAALLPGVKFERGTVEINLLFGIEFEAYLRTIDGQYNQYRYRTGWRSAVEIWWEPTRSLMLSTSFSTTNLYDGISIRAATGWRVRDWFWAGPEVSVSGDASSRQTRIGAHITGFRGRTEYFEWSVGAGYVKDDLQRDGVYARFGMLIRTENGMHLD